jgi:hypothetical protein
MKNLHEKLSQRLTEKKQTSAKMTALAEQTTAGRMTSFSGVFSVSDISEEEKEELETLLLKYANDQDEIGKDLQKLTILTTEVKAINHQAILLHGERIKKAQEIFKKYQEGAFSAWLVHTYGNRQSPYNFLQYYNFYSATPKKLHSKIETMPRQAIYTLASREGNFEKKQEIVISYQGETKQVLLEKIREVFPLSSNDKRKSDPMEKALNFLSRACFLLEDRHISMNDFQAKKMDTLIKSLQESLTKSSSTND